MSEKIDFMLGMVQNMMNISEKNMSNSNMREIYGMTSAMMGNLHYMKMSSSKMSNSSVDSMESMMRSMESMMSSMDSNSKENSMMMKNMMNYMIMMQYSEIMKMMEK